MYSLSTFSEKTTPIVSCCFIVWFIVILGGLFFVVLVLWKKLVISLYYTISFFMITVKIIKYLLESIAFQL